MSFSDFSKAANVSLAEALTVAGLIVKVGREPEENARVSGYPVTWKEPISVELTQAQVPPDARIVNFRDGDFLVATDCARIRDGVFPYLKNTVTKDWFPVIFEYLGETINYGEVQELIAKLKYNSQQPTSQHRDEKIIRTSIPQPAGEIQQHIVLEKHTFIKPANLVHAAKQTPSSNMGKDHTQNHEFVKGAEPLLSADLVNKTLEAIEKLVVERKKATLTLSAPSTSLLSMLNDTSHPVNIYSVTKSVARDKKCGSSVKVQLTFGTKNGRLHSAVVTHKVLGKNEVVLKQSVDGDAGYTWLLSWD